METVPVAVAKKEYEKRAAAAMIVVGAIGIATVAEDIITAGAGIADDLASLIAALGAAKVILAH
jgi:hypothetical protein